MTPATPAAPRSPRDHITMDALSVHPSLVGLPLARPWRRAVAMAIDGVLVLLLGQAPGFLFGLAAAFVLFRVSARSPSGGYLRRSLRLGFRLGGALVLFIVAASGWGAARERLEAGLNGGAASVERAAADGPVTLSASGMDGLRLAGDVLAFRQADADDARRHGEALVARLRDEGVEPEEIREAMVDIATSAPDRPWLAAVADSLLGVAPLPAAADPDSLALAYGAALAAGDEGGAARLRPLVAGALAADSLGALAGRLREATRERAALEARVEELEREAEPGRFLPLLTALGEDLGLELGWIGLYFTATLALWHGRTPGKRLLRIRVIRLNGKPIGWWAAFERFGGYAAGFATGLLGFFQILWDPNRQAIHDKITETAVIREA